jgi:hypothetical protein
VTAEIDEVAGVVLFEDGKKWSEPSSAVRAEIVEADERRTIAVRLVVE